MTNSIYSDFTVVKSLSDCRLINNDMCNFESYSEGFILPYKKKSNSWGIGGVLSKKRKYLNNSGYNGWTSFGGEYEFEDFDISEREVIWLGVIINHWGHFLVDNISRLWFSLESKEKYHIAYVSEDFDLHDNMIRFFELLGIDKTRLIRVTNPTQFKKIIVPDYSKTDSTYSLKYKNIFDEIILNSNYENVSDQVRNLSGKIYFSRRNFKSASSREYGEETIEYIFKKLNCDVVYPELLNLDEQIYLWNNSTEIVCMNGTIPLNVVFCRNHKTKLTILNKTSRVHKNIYDFIKIFSIKHVIFVDVFNSFSDRYVKNLGGGPFVLEVTPKLRHYSKLNEGVDIPKYKKNKIGKYIFLYRFLIKRTLKNAVKRMLRM
ncbi:MULTISPECIES: glycosyltransferase family 61 protein [Klebsiella pneumoniae complex]|uniref:glycosyltransferase family 61 protein n=1 Tax=Klebsiella pneumoniae complex TaxID=3390273 RepID=UPI001083EA61|nr:MULTISPECIES: glycosyltransferase 61 family protein [Klebsiella]MCF0343947.1 glycosyltransferase family 61 protein [Klebsiella pneumoniae]MEA8725883.1 glycosyltransferase 61 family protein [Klebsiella pneumoniae]MEB5804850.1 glycosyltransferase family 61 protein [Klebsiella pneumoniae]TYD28931.1 glycosyltransferase family 61 protein [Klebsiella pneumoniae]WIC34999.1 glycosyltransferase 61 family protein [Klebsiella pneumoniae]